MGSRLGLLRRLTADIGALDAVDLQDDVAQCAAVPLSELKRGDVAMVTGRVRSVVYTPRETVGDVHRGIVRRLCVDRPGVARTPAHRRASSPAG